MVLLLLVIVIVMPAVLAGCGDDTTVTQVESQEPESAGTVAVQTSGAGGSGSGAGQTSAGTSAGECSIFDGTEAATAVGGTLVSSQEFSDTPPNQAKCTFNITVNSTEKVFVMWQMPAEDFDLLKESEDDPITDASGVGDKAYTTFHPDTGRYEMAAAVMGKFTVQVTGDDPDQVRSFVEQMVVYY